MEEEEKEGHGLSFLFSLPTPLFPFTPPRTSQGLGPTKRRERVGRVLYHWSGRQFEEVSRGGGGGASVCAAPPHPPIVKQPSGTKVATANVTKSGL